jgi:hypothetical protein
MEKAFNPWIDIWCNLEEGDPATPRSDLCARNPTDWL